MDPGRVLNKFKINLVIPKEHTYGYISTKAGIHIYMGIFIIFLIRGGMLEYYILQSNGTHKIL